MQEKKHLKMTSWILAAIMLVSLMNMLYYGHIKEGYHVDEIYSYGLANSEYLPFMHFGESGYDVKDWMLEYGAGESIPDIVRNLIKDYKILQECDFDIYNSTIYQDYLVAQANSADTRTTTWVSGEAYAHYVGVSPENTFNYASVYYNQRGDVHPPFFYMLLHTVCSIFQGSFSKWYGLAINIVFMLLTLVILYRMCSKYLGGEQLALCVATVYGMSCGYVSTAIFIRMYAVMTFMVVASCYLHLQLAANHFKMTKKIFWKLAAVTFLGFYTHYYFVIYAIGIAVVCCIRMLCQKRFKSLVTYIFAMAGTGAFGVCVWPFAIKHVFYGYRGVDAIKTSLDGGAYWLKTRLMLDQIWAQIFGGQWWILALSALALGVVLFLWKRKEIPVGKIMMVGFPIMFYVIATAQMVPFYTDRYVMCSYPFWCVMAVGGLYHSVRIICEKKQELQSVKGVKTVPAAGALFALVLVVLNNCYVHTPGYLYLGGQETVEIPENTDCVFVLPDGDWNQSAADSSILAKCRRVGVVYESNLSVLQEGYQYTEGDYLMVCVRYDMDEDAVLAKVHETLGTKDLREVSRTDGSTATRILFAK